ncbi:hypothetical protein HYH03_010389 [Edaphochlamys debaryana]|uniref:Uncharacterized protein n=1 Tax=Edaphochlamys debaryana TaxID=47281 RepID=A0A835XVV8_9CHLO|nr:hypothetical protein HYH03_010389 [Edaphochlamys debaryana]|eukprot:KAG2491178.1 hypothetical protein HYH03_010389 [Edaphochlamys debaryana]
MAAPNAPELTAAATAFLLDKIRACSVRGPYRAVFYSTQLYEGPCPQTVRLGQDLSAAGGTALMQRVFDRVQAEVEATLPFEYLSDLRELSAAWNGVGGWQA